MRNVKRPNMPETLARYAGNWKQDVLRAKEKGNPIPSDLLNRYKQPDVLEALKRMYSDDSGRCYCCYCESQIDAISYPHIEHRKPKSKFPECSFDWDNLHLACERCNAHKGDKWDEKDEILDAVVDEPISSHLGYRIEPLSGVYREALSPRGLTTLEQADLNRLALRKSRLEVLQSTVYAIRAINSMGNDARVHTATQILRDKCSGEYGSLIEWVLDSYLPIKKLLKEQYPHDKKFSDAHPQVLLDREEQVTDSSIVLTDECIKVTQRERKPLDIIDGIIEELRRTPCGMESAHSYHEIAFRALEAVFSPHLCDFAIEKEVNEGQKRIDIVARNTQSNSFFGDLCMLNHIICLYIFIECKNYSYDIKNPELDQLTGRFSNKMGEVGILVCRSIEDNKDWLLKSAHYTLHTGRGLVIVLDDTDIIQMLNYRKAEDYSAISDYMHKKYGEILFH